MNWSTTLIWLFLAVLLSTGTFIVTNQTTEIRREFERLREVKELNRETLKILEVQWAHLTNPDFLRKLTEENFDRLWLIAGTNLNYGSIDDLPYFTESGNENEKN